MRILLPIVSVVVMVSAFHTRIPESFAQLSSPNTVTAAVDSVIPNDNRKPAGRTANNTRHVNLEARVAGWRPDLSVDSLVTIQAFGEVGKQTTIPGPLIRVRAGTTVTVTIANTIAGNPLIISGLRAGSVPNDTVHLAAGATRTVTFTPEEPGTYLYWGAAPGILFHDRHGRDSQLTGAIVIDAATGPIDRDERIMVMTLIEFNSDTITKQVEDIWEVAINGRSWPHTERFQYNVGDTVRWRWVNGTSHVHPMHLHGFHFRVTAKGNGQSDSLYTHETSRLAVTEFMPAGTTFAMAWMPARAGKWLMHCHMVPHITPFPDRAESNRGHDIHDIARHPEQSMAGLVIGITTVEPSRLAFWRKKSVPLLGEGLEESMRLFVQQTKDDSGKRVAKGYVLQRGAEPARDSVEVPGSPLLLTRGRTTRITVINRLNQPTTIHWHGLELQSVYDGVSGWSGSGRQVAPLVAPGDSFTVVLTPPRAGTYMYHTHMDEEAQLNAGMYGPIIVQEPGKKFDSSRDLIFIHGQSVQKGKQLRAINGAANPAPVTLRAGQTYRLRIINLLPAAPAKVSLTSGKDTLSWRSVAKDGAELPALQSFTQHSVQVIGVGEAYDYEWTPSTPMEATLSFFLPREGVESRQRIIVARSP